jgi:hypothetical protein
LPYIGDIRISKVNTNVIRQLLDFLFAPKKGNQNMTPRDKESMHGYGLAADTVRMVRENLAAVFNYARRSNLIDGNPVSDSIPPRKAPARGTHSRWKRHGHSFR